MLAYEYKIKDAGLPNKNSIGSSSPNAIIAFVKQQIGPFLKGSDHYSDSENKITRDLAVYLNQQAIDLKTVFLFIPQDLEEQSRASVDIGLYSSTGGGTYFNAKYYSRAKRFFCFEAKILGVSESIREKEYVQGHNEDNKYLTCGGIERFKKCIHGKELEYAALLGYMKKNDFGYWLSSINSWIIDLTLESPLWTNNDLLVRKSDLSCGYIEELSSLHARKNIKGELYSPIKLYHLWIDLKHY